MKGDLMRLTTLCYLEKDGCYLVLHRNKKEHDENIAAEKLVLRAERSEGIVELARPRDKWIGVGGKFEEGETPEECARSRLHR